MSRRSRRFALVSHTALLLALSAGAGAILAGPTWAAAPAVRLAIAEFNGAGTAEQRDLGGGLQEMLITDLATVESVAIVERLRLADLRKELRLSRSAWADPSTAARVGKLAGATHLVLGSYVFAGKKLRLDARVVDVASGKVTVATKAEGEAEAFFEVQKQLALAIVEAIGVKMTAKQRGLLGRAQTADLDAFLRFSEGVRLFDDAQYDRAIEELQRATEKDAAWPLARTTLDSYTRLAGELRSRASVLAAERAAQLAGERHEQRGAAGALRARLMSVATRKGAAHRAERAAALIFLTGLEGAEVDQFAEDRLRDYYITRYLLDLSDGFPEVPLSPLTPLGERYGLQAVPKAAAEVDAAIALAVTRFATYGHDPKREVDEIRRAKQESVGHGFRSRSFEKLVGHLPRDVRGKTETLARLYAIAKREGEDKWPWRATALRQLAGWHRSSLAMDASTRLLREAAALEKDPDVLRGIAEEVEENGAIARALAGATAPCAREWVTSSMGRISPLARHLAGMAKVKNFCTSDEVVFLRSAHPREIIGQTPVWLFLSRQLPQIWTGPRPDRERSGELRYWSHSRDDKPWALGIVEGTPRSRAALRFDLSHDIPTDFIPGNQRKVDLAGQRPKVSVFFDARNVLTTVPVASKRGTRATVPMTAEGVSLVGGAVEQTAIEGILTSQNAQEISAASKPRAKKALVLPATGAISVLVRREAKRIVVETAGATVTFDAPPAAGGFIGFLIEGHGFVRIGSPQVQALD